MSLRKLMWICVNVVCLIIASSALLAWAGTASSISGQALDASGGAVAGARVSVTNLASGAVVQTTTGPDGTFSVNGLAAGSYQVAIQKTGFDVFKQRVSLQAGQSATIQAALVVQRAVQSMQVRAKAGAVPGATPQPSQQQLFNSSQTIRVLDRKIMDAAGPLAGAAQIVSYTPGANVTGYGNTGATKYTIMLNGIQQGWGGYGGYTSNGSLGITFDGIPVVDPATGLWQSPTIPQTSMIQNTSVTYGPGDSANRWYSNVGGGVEFTPVQPSAKPQIDGALTFGSYNQKNLALNMFTGLHHGWSAVVSGGIGKGDDYRQGPDGFANPSKDGAIFAKTIKTFQAGSVEFGGYYARSGGYRSQVIPGAANPDITINGLPGGPIYSQQTSGFYSTLPYDSYNKYDANEMGLIYGRENLSLDATTVLQNTTWYMHIRRFHERNNDVYSLGPQQNEWNNPHTDSIGDQVSLSKHVSFNVITAGAYYIHGLYNSRNNFYNPADGGSGPGQVVNIGGKIRSSYFSQDDAVAFIQDEISPSPILTITPGIRFAAFQTAYSASPLQDFSFAPGVILSSHCPSTLTSTPGNVSVQSASCDSHQNRSGVEPSINLTVRPLSWLSFYGGFSEELHSPQMGGGGGLFQSVDPATYHLARGQYAQGGFKAHFQQVGPLRNVLFGAAYYHLTYLDQEIDIGLSNGNSIAANGTSVYHGVNAYFDGDLVRNLHLFANVSGEAAKYTTYVTGLNSQNLPVSTYNNLPVSYVPSSTANAGLDYDLQRHDLVVFEPGISYQFVGSQHIFDNSIGAPSNQTMPSYGTVNLSFKAPIRKFLDLDLMLLNVLNKKYNEYEYISSGGYFGTPTGGYTLNYPAPPFTIYGSVDIHF